MRESDLLRKTTVILLDSFSKRSQDMLDEVLGVEGYLDDQEPWEASAIEVREIDR